MVEFNLKMLPKYHVLSVVVRTSLPFRVIQLHLHFYNSYFYFSLSSWSRYVIPDHEYQQNNHLFLLHSNLLAVMSIN